MLAQPLARVLALLRWPRRLILRLPILWWPLSLVLRWPLPLILRRPGRLMLRWMRSGAIVIAPVLSHRR
jgi:hypothetical protein